ncbi:MAG: hypothetical protein ACK5HP_01905 [Bacilli bacterium]
MFKNLIKNYVDKLSTEDINFFAVSNNIYLNEVEKKIIYKEIKENWKILLSDNYYSVLKNIKDKVSLETYFKIENLIKIYRNKYKNYL